MRDGLFSTDEFVEAARGFVLLRLKPGPAESRFGITAAPMAAVADWHGRVTVPSLNLRGDVKGACARLRATLSAFDRRAASRAPYEVPAWASEFMVEGGDRALGAFLQRVHPPWESKSIPLPAFGDLVTVWERVETEGERIMLSRNLMAAFAKRVPAPGKEYAGYADEATLLRRMTYSRNDRLKFDSILAWAAFAPVSRIGFLVERAEKRNEGALNPNVVLCNCMKAIGVMARRHPGVHDRKSTEERDAILAVLPAMVEVLDREGRNNGACRLASDSIVAIVETTGAPEALEAYLHNLGGPKVDSDWMKKMTDRYHAGAATWLEASTGQRLGTDGAAWRRWYAANREKLVWSPRRKAFLVDAKGARRFRERLAAARRER